MDNIIRDNIKKEIEERQRYFKEDAKKIQLRKKNNVTLENVDIMDIQQKLHDNISGYDVNTSGDLNDASSSDRDNVTILWQPIIPLDERAPTPPFPIDKFPGFMRSAIQTVVDVNQFPIELPVLSALAVASTAVHGMVSVKRNDGCKPFPTSLYLLALGDTGERKSTADRYFERALKEFEEEIIIKKTDDLQRYEADKRAWDSTIKGLEKRIENDPTKLDYKQKLNEVMAHEPKKPRIPKIKREDTTIEALGYNLVNEWPYSVISSSDAAGVLDGYSMKPENLKRTLCFYCKLWSGESYQVDRRASGGSFDVSGRVALSLMIHPDSFNEILKTKGNIILDSGFLPRFLITFPQSTQGYRLYKDEEQNLPHVVYFINIIKMLLEMTQERLEKNEPFIVLKPDEFAKIVFIEFYNKIEVGLRPNHKYSYAKGIANRAPEQALRIAAIFETLEHKVDNRPLVSIGRENMERGCAIAEWFLHEGINYLYTGCGPNKEIFRLAMALSTGLCKHNENQIKITQHLYRSGPCCFKNLKKDKREPVYDLLQKHNYIKLSPDRQTIYINPAIKENRP
jgi:hypothetical protein